MFVRGIHRQQNAVEGKSVYPFNQAIRAVMAGQSKMANHFLFPRLDDRLHGAAFGEHFSDVTRRADVMQLPEIQMVGLEQLEGFFQHAERGIARALLGLAGQKRLGTPLFHHLPNILLAPALSPP